MSQAAAKLSSEGILLVRGSAPSGANIFAYIRMTRDKIDQLNRDIAQQRLMDFAAYGEVLASGEGEPSAPIRRFMETHYAFRHDDSDK